jgi:hypothetical protein
MKKGINENVNRLKYLMGILKEQTEDPEIPVGDKEKPSAIYTKIPVNWQNGKNSFELQSDENYTFDGEYKYYLLPTILYYGSEGQIDPKLNPVFFNYGILEGTYSLIKTKDNGEIFEGKPFKVVRNSRGINYPENNTWDEIINDAKSWSIDAYFEGKDSLLKSIYEDTSNFLTPTTKRLIYSDAEPAGWSFLESGTLKDISRFEKIPEVKNGAEYVLDFDSSSKMTFFVRTPKLIRLIPIWDGSQLTFKKSNNTEKQGEIINNSSENVAKTNENRIENGKNLLYEKIEGTTYITENPQKLYHNVGQFNFIDDYINLKEGTKFKKYGDDGAIAWGGKLVFSCKGMIIPTRGGDKYTYNFFYNADGLENDKEYYNDVLTKKLKSIFCTPGGIVDGCIKGDCKNGYGAITYPNGAKYVGNFKNGKYDGYGTLTYSEAKYVGNFKNGERNGYGAITYPNGAKYVGNFKNGKYDGYGTFTYSDGSKYVGNFKDGERNGYGTFTYSDGSKYVGNFKDGLWDGYGTYTNIHGIEFSGNWVDDELNGKSFNDLDKLTKPIEKNKNPNPSKPDKPEPINGKIIELDDKLFLPTKFELVADDIYYNLIREKIPNVTIVSEPDISEQNGYLTYCDVNIKIGTKEYIAIFNEDGLSLGDTVSSKNVKSVWDNKNLTVRPFTSQEIKDAKQDDRLYSDIQLLGGDKFKMEETILRFKQLIK